MGSETETERVISVTLKSSDGDEFVVGEEVANEFATIKRVLEDRASLSDAGAVPLPNVAGKYLSQVLEFSGESIRLRKLAGSGEAKENHERGFLEGMNDDDLKEMLLVANYLENKEVLGLIARECAKRVQNKSAKAARKFFGVECDYTEDELNRITDTYRWAHEGDEIEPDD